MDYNYLKYKRKYLILKELLYNQNQIGGNIDKKIRIICRESSSGINTEIEFISNVIKKIGNYRIEIIFTSTYETQDNKKNYEMVDIIFYIEHVPMIPFYSKKSYLFINQDFLHDWDIEALKDPFYFVNILKYAPEKIREINMKYDPTKISEIIPLYKTKYCKEVLITIDLEIANKSIFVGHGNINAISDREYNPINNTLIHIGGTSPLKNTNLVFDSWKYYMDTYKDDTILIVTLRDTKLTKVTDDYFNKLYPNVIKKQLPSKIIEDLKFPDFSCYNNRLYYYYGNLSLDQLKLLKERAMIALCPSAMEGWGHHIDEYRISKTLVITLDASPMNELITKKSGILIPAKKGDDIRNLCNLKFESCSYTKKYNLQFKTYTADIEDVADRINYAISLSERKRNKLIEKAYKRSLKDSFIFENNMRKLLE